MAQAIADADFPKAARFEVPQLAEISTLLLNVQQKKADVTFVELYFVHQFLEKNPGSVQNIVPHNPIRVFPNTVLLRKGQFEFKAMLDQALTELINLGVVDKLIDKYEPVPGIFYRRESRFEHRRAHRRSCRTTPEWTLPNSGPTAWPLFS